MSELEIFCETFIGRLASDTFSTDGSLTQYLKSDPTKRSGDEADIVDFRISASLIRALGYKEAEVTYNNAKGDHSKPDYAIAIPEYPKLACIIIEDKNTTETNLAKHRPQLEGYLVSRHAPRGLLVNGHLVLGYDNSGTAATPTISLPLAEIVEFWEGVHLLAGKKKGFSALTEEQKTALSVLLKRYGRASFASLANQIDDLTLQSGSSVPHDPEGASWIQGTARIPIINAKAAPENLTNSIRGLIADLEADAAVQFIAHTETLKEHDSLASFLPGSSISYSKRTSEIIDDILAIFPTSKTSIEEKVDFERRLRKVMGGDEPPQGLTSLKTTVRALIGNSGKSKDLIEKLFEAARHMAIRHRRHLDKLDVEFQEAVTVRQQFESWRQRTAMLVIQSQDEHQLKREFFSQTAYVVIIRMLLVRIMEDKKLLKRMFTNGGAAMWFRTVEPYYFAYAVGRSTDHLLDIAYQSAQQIYAHFYSEHLVFDWYKPDRNMVIRILHRLAGFDLSDIDRDIIGTVYNGYVESEHKHESGMYYTPPLVIGHILDRIGYSGTEPLASRILDPASGSGAFLVAAARRFLDAQRSYWVAQGKNDIPSEHIAAVIEQLRQSIYGIDLNPFACALAEINLLIQVLDLVAHARAAGYPVQISRFNVYNSDSLTHSPDTLAAISTGGLEFPTLDLPIEEQLKTGTGTFDEKFGFVVGNPPYVRADEGLTGLSDYREWIKSHHPLKGVRDVLTMKWDLYVPFVALGINLLREGGKLGMIVSSAIETVPYAEALRTLLVTQTSIQEIHFFPGIRLFEDAAVENTILIVENTPPTAKTSVSRLWHQGFPPNVLQEQELPQLVYGQEVFRQNLPQKTIKLSVDSAPLDELCYISVGMVLNSHEKKFPKEFTLDDLLSDIADENHPKPYVGGEDIGHLGISRVRYLEYGPGLRAPERARRPTFPELYNRAKLLYGRFGGTAFDDGTFDPRGFLACNHTVMILMPWHLLQGVDNSQIAVAIAGRDRIKIESKSSAINSLYLLALLSSNTIRDILIAGGRSAISVELQPNDLSKVRIPLPETELMKAICGEVSTAIGETRRLNTLRGQGWTIEPSKVIAPTAAVGGVPYQSFSTARAAWKLTVNNGSAKTTDLKLENRTILRGSTPIISFHNSVNSYAIEWLWRQLIELPSGSTVNSAEGTGFSIPSTPAAAVAALEKLRKLEAITAESMSVLTKATDRIESLLVPIFEDIPHPPIKAVSI